jgi:hypothetical protein
MTIQEIKEFIELAKSNINYKEGEDKERQKSYVRGLEMMYSMMINAVQIDKEELANV